MTGLVDEWEVVVVYLHFSKGFDTIICKILRQPDEARTSKWRLIDNCLNCQAQRVVVTGTRCSWCRVITMGMLQGLRLSPVLFNNFINGLEMVGQECNLSKCAGNSKLR